MNIFRLILPISFLILLVSCDSQQSNKNTQTPKVDTQELLKSIMSVHDEVMPKMGEIIKLRKSLSDKISSGIDNKTAYTNAIASLEKSDDAMMNWMREFDSNKASGETQEVVDYLQSELTKVQEMKEVFYSGLNEAKTLLNE